MIDTIAFYHYVTNVYTYECMYVNIFNYLNTVDLNANLKFRPVISDF